MTEGICQSTESVENYLAKHRIEDLFADLCASLAFHQPKDVRKFLCHELEQYIVNGSKQGLINTDAEYNAVFNMADLLDTGKVTAEQAKKALLALANSEKQYDDIQNFKEIPDEVVRPQFITLANKLLGIQNDIAQKK